ncbi:MAG: tyrosine-type recombinase/integrase [Planctomycetota bacterium]|nr:tyrosine-type recombinase/integrase [Planctomycetota bacterium]
MAKSSSKPRPRKPHADFPLFPHATGRWAKKVKQKLRYFGKVADDPKGEKALAEWLRVKDDLLAGREPRPKVEGFTVADVCNRFLTRKQNRVGTGEITKRTFDEYFATCQLVTTAFNGNRVVIDLTAEDFANLRETIAKNCGPIRLGNQVQRVRSLFKFAYEEGLIDRPIRYGQGFVKPNRKALREARNRRAARMFESPEILRMLDAADVHLEAMLLLGCNAGFGNGDCGKLPLAAVNLDAGWIDFPRPKTAVARRVPLWPETVRALRASLARRPTPKDDEAKPLFFVTKYGKSWATEMKGCPVSQQTGKLLKALGLQKDGRGFYSLRHVFETIGGESRDQVAVNAIMGHSDETMAATYRERIGDDRLLAVTDHVRTWLFGTDVLTVRP